EQLGHASISGLFDRAPDELHGADKRVFPSRTTKTDNFQRLLHSFADSLRQGSQLNQYVAAPKLPMIERLAPPRDVRLGACFQYASVQPARRNGASDGREPEEPQLRQGPTAHENRGPGAPGWIHRGIGHGNADEMDKRQRQS